MKKTTIAALQKLGLRDQKRQRNTQEPEHTERINNTPAGTSLSGHQIPEEQRQTSTGPLFFQDSQNNDFTKANITNVAGNGNIIQNYHSQSSSVVKEITADMITSATPALPLVFKGRDDLVDQGVDILCRQSLRFLAILGAGGMGKTSLALHIIDNPAVKQKFGQRCHFLPCDIFENAEALTQGLVSIMRIMLQENQGKQESLFNHLKATQHDLLIIFDNFETSWNNYSSRTDIRNLLEKIAGCERVSIIVTMRGPHGPGDIPWKALGDDSGIPQLSPAAANEAIKAFAGPKVESSETSDSIIGQLMYELDYVPLAIKLSAYHARKISLDALTEMWKNHKTGMLQDATTQDSRSTSVEFSINLSIQLLDKNKSNNHLLSILSFLPNGVPSWESNLNKMISKSPVGSVISQAKSTIRNLLPGQKHLLSTKSNDPSSSRNLSLEISMLLDTSLIYIQNEGLRMLAPIREFIQSQSPTSQEIIDQLERFYSQFLEDLPDNDMEAQPALQLHINNIEKIYKSQISSCHSKSSCVFAVDILYRFQRFDSVSISLIDLILEKNKNIKKDDEVRMKLRKARILKLMGRFQNAMAQVMSVKDSINEQSLSQPEADILGKCFHILRGIYSAQAQYEEAINMSLQAQKYFKQSENLWAQANSMSWLGEIYYKQARYKEAFEMYSEAQQLFHQIGNELGVAECLKRLGDIYRVQERNDDAIQMISDAQKQFQTFGNQMRAAECLLSLGELYRNQERYDEATEMLIKAQKQFEEIGLKNGLANCMRILGLVYMDQGQYDEAVDMFSNARIQFQNIGKIVDVAGCYRYLGRTYRLQRQYEKAKEAFTEALELLKGFTGERYYIGYTLWEFGDLFFDMKDFVEARRKYEEARDIFSSHGQLEKELDALLHSSVFPCINPHSTLSYASNSSEAMGVIFASWIPGVGTSINLDTDDIHLNDTVVEGSTLASDAQPTVLSSTQVNNTGATQTQFQSTLAHATSFITETTNASTSTATSPPCVPSALSSSVSQADATSTVPQSSSATSALTANTPAAYNGRNANNNSGLSTTLTSGSSP
ncbi:TPR-like protein [Dendrothele bispora CBS 962.96]|uniref:TPR-like protein n=1 Tax=Dendrothele bispora (strain CBS 962.96) TaxID=1314807 RepID=A0A4S8LJA9_DENBC|nr:TPR-like protein [Dendrothele bispora CBS 962.96]